ncbi:MAG TPA: cytochrome P450 [Steroidobacteraceae bacterium]
MSAIMASVPELDIDLFAEASLKAPFDDYRRLRDAGALVKLQRPDVYAMGRFAHVQAALRAPDLLKSGEGVGFSEAFNAPRGMNVLQSDGELHRRMRAVVMRPLWPAKLKEARGNLKAMMTARVAALIGKGRFDAMQGLASFLPIEAIAHLVGLPTVGRERMLEWAAATFNLIGPEQDSRDLALLAGARSFMMGLNEQSVREGSWAGELFAAARSGELTLVEAMAAISAYIIPSLDTTILAKGHLLHNLAKHPDQWALLLARPELIPSAVLEGVRHDSVIRWFSRVAVSDYRCEESIVPQGARIMLLYGCANRDERRYAAPDNFDVSRDSRDHLAWGTGTHMCAGMHLARIEMEVLLEALVETRVALTAGEPVRGANRGLFGFTELPFQIDPQTSSSRSNNLVTGDGPHGHH